MKTSGVSCVPKFGLLFFWDTLLHRLNHQWPAKLLFEMCCFHAGIARERGWVKACHDGLGHFFPTLPWGVRARQDGFGHFFFFICPFDRGGVGESKAI